MIVVLKKNAGEEALRALTDKLASYGLQSRLIEGESTALVAVIGDAARLDAEILRSLPCVETVLRVGEPYQKAGRRLHPDDTVVEVSGVRIGGGAFAMIAGPCTVESREQLLTVAQSVKASGAQLLRGGAFKPRTSPYDFQGLGADGLRLLSEAKRITGLPVVSEIMSPEQLPLYEDVDLLQVGARNMQNYELLRELGHIRKPVLLKRGPSAALRELLLAAEYIMAGGNGQIVLCERGIRSFETETRNTLDLAAVPALHERTHLPVIVDPSHATGEARYVRPMALAAVAAGADGLMIEVHNDPAQALCDGPQAITPPEFGELAAAVCRVRSAIGA